MKTTNPDSSFMNSILIAICIFCAILSVTMFRQMKHTESTFKDKNAALVRERAELKSQFDALNEAFEKSKLSTGSLENERKSIATEFARHEKEYGELEVRSAKALYVLKRENKAMRKKIDAFKKASAAELIKQLASRESNDSIKRILAGTLTNIELAKEGKYVELKPIVLTATNEKPPEPKVESTTSTKQGKIISLNRKNSLAVINLGRAQGVKEGQYCRVMNDRGEVASGMIIRTRYDISAAFLDTFFANYTIDDVKEEEKVVMN